MRKVSKPREPSKASLREIPEVDFTRAKVRRLGLTASWKILSRNLAALLTPPSP